MQGFYIAILIFGIHTERENARNEKVYKLFIAKVFGLDPARAIRAFAKMMKKKIVIPTVLMYDGKEKNLFSKFFGVKTCSWFFDIEISFA